MELSSLTELDFNESGEWPLPIKIVAILLVTALVWAGGYYFIMKDKQAELETLEHTEMQLKREFVTKQENAWNLAKYKAQLAEMRVTFSSMLKQLPRKNEVADLLIDISRTGLVNGLEFELFKPGAERPVDFYAEMPIDMKVTGTYHQFSGFVSDVASLPRIVILHDLSMARLSKAGDKMTMDISAKTYRYLGSEGQ
jgi:type IV pilus assembly protein PilO